MTDDFGPYARVLLFGTKRDFDDVRRDLEKEFAERNWRTFYEEDRPDWFSASSPGGLHIGYWAAPDGVLSTSEREKRSAFPTLIRVWVSDCDV